MLSETELMARIELLRTKLGQLVLKYGTRSSEVLAMSQHLDEVLNQYYRLTIKKESKYASNCRK